MKTLTKISTLALFISFVSCKMNQHNSMVYRVNSAKVDCIGISPMSCYQVQKGDSINTDHWELFYSPIEGFDFEPGHVYLISVKEIALPKNEIPADGSSLKYELIEVIEKTQDPLMALHDIYKVTQLFGVQVFTNDSLRRVPTMEIFISEKRISGTDGCNTYSASIKELSETKISFSPIAATRMMCPDMDMSIPDLFNRALGTIRAYKKSNGILELMNAKDEVAIELKKID